MIRKSETTVRREYLIERREKLRRALDRVRSEVEARRAGLAAKDPCAWLDRTAEAEAERDPARYAATVMATELELVEQALRRLEREADDPAAAAVCTRCGGRISAERLALLPHAHRCAACATGGARRRQSRSLAG